MSDDHAMKRWILLFAMLLALVPVGAVAAPADLTADPVITVTSDRGTYIAGMPASIRVQVSGGTGERLTVFLRTADAVLTEVPGCGVNEIHTADFVCPNKPYLYLNSRVVVRIGETDTDTKLLLVRPVVSTFPVHSRGSDGTHELLFYPDDEPHFRVELVPSRPTMCIRHQVQVLRAAGWRTILSGGCKYPAAAGKPTYWRWYGTHPVGYHFRVRATFDGDINNVGGPGPWTRIRFIRP